MNTLKWILTIVFLDVTLGMLFVKYVDPIAFSRQHPYVVLLVTGTIISLPYIYGHYKKLKFTEHTRVSIQFIEG